MNTPIIITEEYWRNIHLSIVRLCGRIKFNGHSYTIVNKEGKDIFQCSYEAEKAGRDKAIEPGEPCDLVQDEWIPIYRTLGRDKTMELVKKGVDLKEAKKLCKNVKK